MALHGLPPELQQAPGTFPLMPMGERLEIIVWEDGARDSDGGEAVPDAPDALMVQRLIF